MPTAEFLQLLVVAGIAGFVGYLLGRASAGSAPARSAPSSPLPGPESEPPPRRTTSPPPAGAGADQPIPDRVPPRRSSAPPPAAAGLMKRDD